MTPSPPKRMPAPLFETLRGVVGKKYQTMLENPTSMVRPHFTLLSAVHTLVEIPYETDEQRAEAIEQMDKLFVDVFMKAIMYEKILGRIPPDVEFDFTMALTFSVVTEYMEALVSR